MFAVPALFLFVLTASQVAPAPVTPTSFQVLAKRAEEAKDTEHLSEAVKLYSEALRQRPAWSEGWWSLASVLYEQERFAEAKTAFARFAKMSAKPGPAYAFLALCEYETKEYDQSLRHFQAWSRSGFPGTDALLDVAGFHWALLLTREEHFAQALYLLATKAGKLGNRPGLVEAMGLASLRIAKLPEDYPAQKREQVWLAGEAAVFAAKRDYLRSNEFVLRLASRYGQEPNVNYFLGTQLGFQRKFPEAEEKYIKELEISPTHVAAMVELALVQIENYKAVEAGVVAERAVALEPQNARAHLAFGKSLLATGHIAEAAHQLEIAKELAPESPPVRSSLANAYLRLGRVQEAKRESEAFMALKDKEEVLVPVQEKLQPTKKKAQTKQ